MRPYDLVLFGATGFTGGLVAEELLTRARDLRWAICGRDRAKLEAVRTRLAALDARATALPILVADSHDAAALNQVVSACRVVCTTVGPYAEHGSALVAACASSGTHYCDLCGEVPWIRRMIDAHHERAKQTRARIVPACGFDSIPSDLGVLVLQREMQTRFGECAQSATLFVRSLRGGASGGTIASMFGVLDEARRDPDTVRLLVDPYSLNPDGERSGAEGRDSFGISVERVRRRVTAPFVMAAINTRVVRRSNALLAWPYGRQFRYREVMSFPLGPAGILRASATALGLAGLTLTAAVAPTRKLLERLLPKAGQGPNARERAHGSFRLELRGEALPHELTVQIGGDRDPGYGFTAIMLAEAALCLAEDDLRDTLPGGVLTPASALGMHLVERLRRAGMLLEVRSSS
jgi:short subunit dehydrogenase-like uncharacterized protein